MAFVLLLQQVSLNTPKFHVSSLFPVWILGCGSSLQLLNDTQLLAPPHVSINFPNSYSQPDLHEECQDTYNPPLGFQLAQRKGLSAVYASCSDEIDMYVLNALPVNDRTLPLILFFGKNSMHSLEGTIVASSFFVVPVCPCSPVRYIIYTVYFYNFNCHNYSSKKFCHFLKFVSLLSFAGLACTLRGTAMLGPCMCRGFSLPSLNVEHGQKIHTKHPKHK